MSAVSVVIPAYRSAETIRRAVQSVLNQDHPVKEVLVIDDGSPDDIEGPIADLAPLVRVIRQANGGAGSARNLGLDSATGDWIAFLDADDEWLPNKIAVQLGAAEKHPGLGLIMAEFEVRQPGATAGTRIRRPEIPANTPLELAGNNAMRFAAACWTGTVLLRRDVLGEERFRTDLRTAEDRELWYRVSSRTPVLAVDEVLAVQHVTPGSLSTCDIDDDCANMQRVVDLHSDDLTIPERNAWRIELLRRRAAVHLAEGRPRAARVAASERLRHDFWNPEAWYIWFKAFVGRAR